MGTNTKSIWQKCECQVCGPGYVIHSDWLNPPKLCKFSQIKGTELLDAIDPKLNTAIFGATEPEIEKLAKLATTCVLAA